MSGGLVTIIGLTAAACTTASFVPQVIHILRTRQVAGISGIMYSVFCVGVLLWTIYGVAIASTPVILANTITFVLAVIVLALKLIYERRTDR
jgi:MtN3 and saliva related transmembrane protein